MAQEENDYILAAIRTILQIPDFFTLRSWGRPYSDNLQCMSALYERILKQLYHLVKNGPTTNHSFCWRSSSGSGYSVCKFASGS